MFVFCGLNLNNKHFLWICEGKISKLESKVKNSPHEKGRESEVAGEAELARFSSRVVP